MRENNALITIKELYAAPEKFAGQTVTVGGWVKSNRDSKNIGFLVLNDGSCFQTLQVV